MKGSSYGENVRPVQVRTRDVKREEREFWRSNTASIGDSVEGLYRLAHAHVAGNERDASNRELLDALGITHILNVTSQLPLHFETQGLVCKRLPASDSGNQNLKQYFEDAILFIGNETALFMIFIELAFVSIVTYEIGTRIIRLSKKNFGVVFT